MQNKLLKLFLRAVFFQNITKILKAYKIFICTLFLFKKAGDTMQNKFVKILLLIIIILFVTGLCIFIGIDFATKTLLLVMAIDYILGLALAINGNSKHGDGKLSSKVGYSGIVRKITILLLVGVSALIDSFIIKSGFDFAYIKEIAVITFIINELISIIENARLAGVDIPDVIIQLIESIKNIKMKNKDKK